MDASIEGIASVSYFVIKAVTCEYKALCYAVHPITSCFFFSSELLLPVFKNKTWIHPFSHFNMCECKEISNAMFPFPNESLHRDTMQIRMWKVWYDTTKWQLEPWGSTDPNQDYSKGASRFSSVQPWMVQVLLPQYGYETSQRLVMLPWNQWWYNDTQ